jgi:hypothetical protein
MLGEFISTSLPDSIKRQEEVEAFSKKFNVWQQLVELLMHAEKIALMGGIIAVISIGQFLLFEVNANEVSQILDLTSYDIKKVCAQNGKRYVRSHNVAEFLKLAQEFLSNRENSLSNGEIERKTKCL